MTMTRFACLWAAMILVGGVACGGGSAPDDQGTATDDSSGSETTVAAEPPPPALRPVPVRILHLAAGASQASASATAGTDAQVSDVAFRQVSEYQEIVPPTAEGIVPVTIQVGEASGSLDAPYRAGVPATIIVVSNPQDPTQIAVTATEDEALAVTGQIRGRFVNALLGTEAIDFCLPGETARTAGRPLFTGVQYGQVAGTMTAAHYIPVPVTGGTPLQVRVAAERGCTGRVIGTATVPAPDGSIPHNLTLAVVGRMAGRPAVARELLICEDAPGPSACVAIPLR